MPSDLSAICEELRQIGLRPETPAGREKLEEALSSKWDGVKVAAAKALSQWGDPRSLCSLKVLLSTLVAKPGRLGGVSAVARLLATHMQASDLDWAIEVFIHQSRAANRHAVHLLFGAFDPNEVRRRLVSQKLHGGKLERDVREAIGRAEWRARKERI